MERNGYMETVVEKRDGESSVDNLEKVSIGGKVGILDDTKKVNFHGINKDLDREVAYDVTKSILSLQKEPVNELTRSETYQKFN